MTSSRTRPLAVWWTRLARGVVEVALALLVLGVVAGAGLVVSGADDVSFGGERLSVENGAVQLRIRPTMTSLSTEGSERVAWELRRFYGQEYGRGATPVEQVPEVELRVEQPSTRLWAAALGSIVLFAALLAAFLFTLRSLLAHAEVGLAFSGKGARGLRRMAFIVGGGAIAVTALRHLTAVTAVRDAGGSGTLGVSWSIPFAWLGVALLLLALSEVWRQGVVLQRDAQVTV